MKKFLIIGICLFVSSPCYSKWKKVFEVDNFIEYFEMNSVKKINDTIYIWSMRDYKKPLKSGNLSKKYFIQFDCIKKRYHVLSIIGYKTKMGKGRNFEYIKNVYNSKNQFDWIYPSFNSEDEIRLNAVCND